MSSMSAVIGSNVPYLRRFTRALTGSQQSGDSYVAALLEALIADSALLNPELPPKVGLYQALVRILDSVPLNNLPGASPAGFERNLDAIMPLPRRAFLLRTVEGFDMDETAAILGVDKAEAEELIDEAGREIASQVATDVLIIEDEPMIAMDLEGLVEGLGHRVVATAATRREAVKSVAERQPGLILADIQLADGSSGIDAVNDLLQEFDVPVIFITAYPERLLTAERPEPTFLITKPFQSDTVKAIISQALFFDQRAGKRRSVTA